MIQRRFDVGIVGAGPAGASAAISLARRGYSVVLIDRANFPRGKLCGDFLNPINWPLFERLGVATELLKLPHEKISGFRISCSTGEETAFSFPHHYGQPHFGLGLNRLHFDYLMLNTATRAGAAPRQGSKVKDIKKEPGHWKVLLATPTGDETLETRFLIGADGRNSAVARTLGIVNPDPSGRRYVGFQLHFREVRMTNDYVQIHLFPGGYAGLGAVGGGITNLCCSLEQRLAKRFSRFDELLQSVLFKNPQLKKALADGVPWGGPRSTFPVYTPRRRSFGDGFVLVGDAAYGPEPVTGEGVYFALKSAELASTVIHEGFAKGDLSGNQTSRYEVACKRVLSRRERLNRMNRGLVYHPFLLRPLVRLSSYTSFPIGPLMRLVMQTSSQPGSVES